MACCLSAVNTMPVWKAGSHSSWSHSVGCQPATHIAPLYQLGAWPWLSLAGPPALSLWGEPGKLVWNGNYRGRWSSFLSLQRKVWLPLFVRGSDTVNPPCSDPDGSWQGEWEPPLPFLTGMQTPRAWLPPETKLPCCPMPLGAWQPQIRLWRKWVSWVGREHLSTELNWTVTYPHYTKK